MDLSACRSVWKVSVDESPCEVVVENGQAFGCGLVLFHQGVHSCQELWLDQDFSVSVRTAVRGCGVVGSTKELHPVKEWVKPFKKNIDTRIWTLSAFCFTVKCKILGQFDRHWVIFSQAWQ